VPPSPLHLFPLWVPSVYLPVHRAPLGQDVINDGRLSPPPAATTFPKAISPGSNR
jgi:hypothetical protein